MTITYPACLRCVLLATVCAPLLSTAARADAVPRLAINGFCPVSITIDKQWRTGQAGQKAAYDGRLYRFASAENRKRFETDPAKYVPAFGGDCLVTWKTKGKRVAGRVEFGAFYDGRLLLFADADARETFRSDSGVYATADLAYGGRSPIALVDEDESVRGKEEFAVHHRGFRYRFATQAGRKTFLAAPEKYLVERREVEVAAGEKTVTATGKSACAFCDFKVWPMLTEGELGLAIEAEDGTVYIVEHADTKFPELYNDRFDGITLTVSGREIKRDGNTVWLVPESLVAGT